MGSSGGDYIYSGGGGGSSLSSVSIPQLCRDRFFSCNEIAIAAIMKVSFVLPFVAAAAAAALDLTVTTSAGRIRGHKAPEVKGVYEFLGVPFAKPPVGKLRFAPPAKLGRVASSAVFVADKYVSFSGV